MTEFSIAIAGRVVGIRALYANAKEFCQGYLTDGEPDFTVTISPEDVDFERRKSASEDEMEGIPIRHFSSEYLETLAIYRKIVEKMLDYNAFLFHGSAISVDGEGYLFTAKSGTGKSTHTNLWRTWFGERCITVNDDKPLLLVEEDRVMVCGTPWDGKHRMSNNIMVPLKGLVVLERGQINEIEPIGAACALPLLLQQSYRPSTALGLSRTLCLLEQVMQKTGLYRLRCNMDIEAAKLAYEGMNRKDN